MEQLNPEQLNLEQKKKIKPKEASSDLTKLFAAIIFAGEVFRKNIPQNEMQAVVKRSVESAKLVVQEVDGNN